MGYNRKENHVVGPLQEKVCQIMTQSFARYINHGSRGNLFYVAKAAIMALYARCTTLKGEWETVAWLLLHIFKSYDAWDKDFYWPFSEKLSSWIIHVVSDHDIGPNPYLRIKF